ncbi:uncharacterized protein LOC129222594 [Uloborus diversus]|uniref:uncharacterized protein LOC129222594 n=1 Tax=Uloborus diversus TaxID=327109 RepID=UPI0024099CA7|nr:uncharacterized protein LOC129222594 [Uloborus diversus]
MSVDAERFKFLNLEVREFNFDASAEIKEILLKNDVEDILNVLSGAVQDLSSLIIEFEQRRKLKENLQDLLKVQNKAFKKLTLLKEEHQKQEEEKENIAQATTLRREELALYERNLGLKIKPHYTTSAFESAISFTFHDINEKKSQEFAELVLVTDGKKYKVTSCIPLVPELDEFIGSLNETNDLSTFIFKVRKKASIISSKIH